MKFITEFLNRFSLKSPAFFQVIQTLSIVAAAIAGIPALIAQFQSDLGISVPGWMIDYSNKAVVIAAAVAWIIAKLPVKSPEINKISTLRKLPFSEKKKEIN